MKRNPSITSVRSRTERLTGGSDGTCRRLTSTTPRRKKQACAANAIPTPLTSMRPPASSGPPIIATFAPIVITTIACISCSLGTIDGSSELRTGWPKAITVPNMMASTTVIGTLMTSVHTAAADNASAIAPPNWVSSRMRLRSWRSAIAPASSTKHTTGAPSANSTQPLAESDSSSVSPTSHSKVNLSADMTIDTDTALAHSSQKPVRRSELEACTDSAISCCTTASPMRVNGR